MTPAGPALASGPTQGADRVDRVGSCGDRHDPCEGAAGAGTGPGSDRWAHRAAERSVALGVALVGFVAAAGIMTDNSLLTHMATGREILDTGSVPAVDPYSRFGHGQPWTVQSWLVSVVYAGLDRGFGPAAIRAFHGLLGAGVGLGLWRLSAPARPWPRRAALTLAPVVIGVGLWSPRPLMVGLAALVGVLVLLRSDRPGWWLVPLMWVWVNAHGSFPLGPGLLVLVVVGQWLDQGRPFRPVRTGRSRASRLLGWSVLGLVLGAVGPLGPRVLLFPLAVLRRGEAMSGVVEWQAPSYSTPWELAWLALALVPVVAARRRARWADLVPMVVFVVAASLAIRNVAPASVALAALAAPALGPGVRAGPGQGAPRRSPEPGEGPAAGPRRLGPAVVRAVTVAAGAGLVVAVVAVLSAPGLDLERYPVAEVDRLEAEGLVPAGDPADGPVVVHREAVGNYLTWRYGAAAGVFVDDRFDFHDQGLLADHRGLLTARDPRPILDRREADVVVWEADGPLTSWLTEAAEWTVGPGEEWVVACRRGSPAFDRCLRAALG